MRGYKTEVDPGPVTGESRRPWSGFAGSGLRPMNGTGRVMSYPARDGSQKVNSEGDGRDSALIRVQELGDAALSRKTVWKKLWAIELCRRRRRGPPSQ